MQSHVPSFNPPTSGSAAHQSALKRAFSDKGIADPFAPTVQKHRQEQARAAPSVRRNPIVDVRYAADGSVEVPPSIPPGVPIIGTPPGERIPGEHSKSAAHAQAAAARARAAAAELPWADDRSRNPSVAAVARVRPAIPPDPPRSFPPRREPSRGERSTLTFHPENPRFVWSDLEQTWVDHEGSTEATYRGTRSRSRPPRPDRDPPDPYRVTL